MDSLSTSPAGWGRRGARRLQQGATSLRWRAYALVLLLEAATMAIVPLLPRFVADLQLTGFESGCLIAASPFATGLLALPGGRFVARVGVRRATVGAGLVAAIATAAQPLLPSFELAVIARFLLGGAIGIVWIGGASWLSRTERTRASGGLGGMAVVAGAGVAIGPAVMGALSSAIGMTAAFATLGALTLAVAVALLDAPDAAAADHGHAASRTPIRVALRDPTIAAAAASIGVGGFAVAALTVLAPLDLEQEGLSESAIGLIVGAGMGLFVVSGAVLTARGAVVMGHRTLLAVGALQVIGLTPAALVPTPVTLTLALLWLGALTGIIGTASLPSANHAAVHAGIAPEVAFGIVYTAWAGLTVAGPLAAGVLRDGLGTQSYVAIEAATLAGMAVLALAVHRLVLAARR